MGKLSHIDEDGKAQMVDVGGKRLQYRVARASGFIKLEKATVGLIKQNDIKKGDVLTVSEIAGIFAAKKTFELIPLCHPLQITKVAVKAKIEENGVRILSSVSCVGQTGVEMEALTAVNVALLTIYDMCKAVDKNMKMEDILLIEKTKKDISL